MINEVFVIETDKNGQILALGFGCLEIFFLQNLVVWLIFMFVPVNSYGHESG